MNGISRTEAAGGAPPGVAGTFLWLWAAAFSLFAAAFPIAGNAGAMFSATATARLEIVSIDGGSLADLKISGLTCPPCTFGGGFASGNAVYAADGSAVVIGADADNLAVNESVPEGLSLIAEASGSALPDGTADAGFAAFASVEMENLSLTDTFTIGFRLIWSLSAIAGIDNPGADDAFAGADIIVDTALFLLEEFVESDALFGPFGLQTLSDSTLFSLTLLPEEFDYIDIDIAVGGFAVSSAVPEPGSWSLLALGLALLRAQRRHKRNSTAR